MALCCPGNGNKIISSAGKSLMKMELHTREECETSKEMEREIVFTHRNAAIQGSGLGIKKQVQVIAILC